MTILTTDWERLYTGRHSDGPGSASIRVAPEGCLDLSIACLFPGGEPCLWYTLSRDAFTESVQMPNLQSIDVAFQEVHGQPSKVRCQLRLADEPLRDVFYALVNDVVDDLSVASDDIKAMKLLTTRLELWEQLLQPEDGRGISPAKRRGLFGEILVLQELIRAHGPHSDVVFGWVGAEQQHQDFQYTDLAIEVKATATLQPQTLSISSERQLDGTGVDRLALAHASLDERQGGLGTSLNDIIEEVRTELAPNPRGQQYFMRKVFRLGWLPTDEALYSEPHYSLRSPLVWYEITEGFPRITESMCPEGVGKVSYAIQVAALQPFIVEGREIVKLAVKAQ